MELLRSLSAIILLMLIFVSTGTINSFAVNPEYLAKNSITAGDNSINAIASGKSEIIVVINSSQKPESYHSSKFLSYIEREKSKLLDESRAEFPDQKRNFINSLAIAKYLFSEKQYSASAALYERSLNLLGKNTSGQRKLEGMVTASYYGSGRHVRGLRFICKRYQFRPKWDYRFRHAIHAHLRSLAKNLGHKYAENVVKQLRKNPKCRRDDISPIWIPIHLTDMRWLERSTPVSKVKYGFSDKNDRATATRLLKEANHGFMDYLLFINGNYSKILEDYPNSYISDLALLANGDNTNYSTAKSALLEYIEKYKKHRVLAIQKLLRRVSAEGDNQARISFLNQYGSVLFNIPDTGKIWFQINDFTRVWVPGGQLKEISLQAIDLIAKYYTQCPHFASAINKGNIDTVRASVLNFLDSYKIVIGKEYGFSGYYGKSTDSEYYNLCIAEFQPKQLQNLLDFLAPFSEALNTQDAQLLFEFGRKLKICGDIREDAMFGRNRKKSPIDAYCETLLNSVIELNLEKISFHQIAALLLRRANEINPTNMADALFLAGLSLRNTRDYKGYVELMDEYVEYYPNGKFADDALTEIGWFYLAIADNAGKADQHFLKVVENYVGRNAYDNALNWLVISKRSQGDFASAMFYSAKLLATVASDRILKKIEGRDEAIRTISILYASKKPNYTIGERIFGTSFFGEHTEIFVTQVKPGTNLLNQGDVIHTVNGKQVSNANGFYAILKELKDNEKSTININNSPNLNIPLADFGL